MKPIALAVALALAAPALSLAAPAQAAAAAQPAAKPAVKPVPAWVEQSNQYTQILIKAQADFSPEGFSFFGIPGYDDKVTDLRPGVNERYRAAMLKARAQLQEKLAVERNANVRQDLQILLGAIDQSVQGSELNQKLLLPWFDAPQTVFSGMNALLSDQTPPERRAKALARLQAYVGQAPGSQPLTVLARQRYEERLSDPALLQPSKLEVEQALANVETYAAGIRKLFGKYGIGGADAALEAMETQLREYGRWTREQVLPKARTDARLPEELYAFQLKQFGIDVEPQTLIRRAQVEFMETRAAMRQLAPLVVQAKGLKVADPHDYVAVIAALKRDSIPNDQLEGRYRKIIDAIDPIILREKVVDVPQRPMVMRLGSEAESAAQPAPHFLPAPLVGNTGQQGQFVLPVGVPSADGKALHYDDFNYESAAWTLSAHEGRPGHELQFTAMVERGISLARTMFAFNSVNVEGWALYAEAEMVPYEPLDGQLIALQFRLLRAARAILDPMLNLGQTDRASAGKVLREQVGFSEAMTKQELDRYMFNMPGQAGSYFYGYSRILELRMETELAVGDRFDRLSFNNFLLDQGLLPPALLAKAVQEDYVPQRKGK